MIGVLLKGVVIGILVSAPMGPVGILCIQRTIKRGRLHGFVTGLGATLSDLIYALVTLIGIGFMMDFIEANRLIFQILGSLMLGGFGIYLSRTNPIRGLKSNAEDSTDYGRYFLSAFLLTFSNVLIVFLYLALFAQLKFVAENYSFVIVLGLLGIALGAIGWWFGITHLVTKMKRWFNIRSIWMINRVIGYTAIGIAIIGIILAVTNLFTNISL